MQNTSNKKQYFRLDVLIILLVLLAVSFHDWKSQTSFRVVVDGDSMSPTYQNNDIITATSMYSRIIKDDVVILRLPKSVIIKRAIYLPGEIFWVMKFDQVHWEPIPENTVNDFIALNLWEIKKIKVPKDKIWLEGDNRDESYDSRICGFFDMKNIIGVVSPWQSTKLKKQNHAIVQRLYELKKQGKVINRENFISNATATDF